MQRPIITYPNKRLFLRSEPVVSFDESLHELLDDMYETMMNGYGVGLAAIQVDVPLRLFLANIPDENDEIKKENLLEFINPELEFIGDEKILFNEGCLSVPNFFEEVERYQSVRVRFQDRFGKAQTLEASDFLAVVIQHEFEHLNGHLFIEKLSYSQRKLFDKEFKQMQKAKKSGKALNSNAPSAKERNAQKIQSTKTQNANAQTQTPLNSTQNTQKSPNDKAQATPKSAQKALNTQATPKSPPNSAPKPTHTPTPEPKNAPKSAKNRIRPIQKESK